MEATESIMTTTEPEEISPFLESNDALGKKEELRHRMDKNGYLFFRALIDTNEILHVRREILEICRRHGWLDKSRELMDGFACGPPRVEGQEAYGPVFDEVQRLESFHALAHTPALLAVIEGLVGEPVLVHPRNIFRIIFPQNTKETTPPHQDYIHIRGTPETYTAWIPLGDCPRGLGGLVILAGSHKGGIYTYRPAHGAGHSGVDTTSLLRESEGATQPLRWVSSEYRLGDCLLFHSHTVHQGLYNLTQDRLRLSVDYRYQGQSQPVTKGSLLPHFNRTPWSEIYRGWKSTRYQYYWEKMNLTIVA